MKSAGTGPRLAARARRLTVSPTVAMAARARALKEKGVRVLDFTVGEPDQPTPRHVLEAGKAALDAGRTKYAPAAGLPELRAAVAHRYREDFQVAFAPEEVTVAVGGKQALALLYQAILDRGSEVVVPIPAWPTFAEAARVAGGTPVFVPLARRERLARHRPRGGQGDLAEDPRRRREQPLEPDRGGRPPEELLKIARLAKKHGFWLLYDDTYAHLVFRRGRAAGAAGGEGRGGRPPRGRRDGVQDLLHDRVAGGLGDGTEGARGGVHGPQLALRSGAGHVLPDRGRRSAHGPAGRRARDGGGVPPAPRLHPPGGCGDARRHLPRARGRVLRLPGRVPVPVEGGPGHARPRREAARGEGGGGRPGRGLSRARSLPAVLRDRLRGPAGRCAEDRRVPGRARPGGARANSEAAGPRAGDPGPPLPPLATREGLRGARLARSRPGSRCGASSSPPSRTGSGRRRAARRASAS